MTNERHRHYIDDGGGWDEVFPAGKYEIVHAKVENEIFKRQVIEGELIFGNRKFNRGQGDDYDLINAVADCTQMPYKIECGGIVIWEGYFNRDVDFNVDEDNCILKGIPNPEDKYTCLLRYGDTEYTWSDGTEYIYFYERTGEPRVRNQYWTYARKLKDYLQLIVSNASYMYCADYAGDVVSTLLWQDNFPDATGIAYNYMLGVGNTPFEELFLMMLWRTRLPYGTNEPWEDTAMTFNKITGWLKNMFQIYWYVDTNGKVRFEHISWFRQGFAHAAHTDVGTEELDLTTTIDPKTGRAADWRCNKWEWDRNKLYSIEEFTMKDAFYDDFEGLPITYDEDCTYDYPNQNIRKVEIADLMTDLQMIDDDETQVDNAGYMLFACKEENLLRSNAAITGWTNDGAIPYAVLATTGSTIWDNEPGASSAVDAALPAACWSNNLGANLGAAALGDTFTLRVQCVIRNTPPSQPPLMAIYDAVGGNLISNVVAIVAAAPPGGNTQNYTLTINGLAGPYNLWYLRISNAVGTADWSGKFWIDRDELEWVIQWEVGAISAAWRINNHLSWANLHDNYWEHERVRLAGNMNGVNRVIGVNPFLSRAPNKVQETIKFPKPAGFCCTVIENLNYFTTDMGYGYPDKIIEGKNYIELDLRYTD